MIAKSPEIFPILIPILIIFIPVVILTIIVGIKLIIKNVNKSKQRKTCASLDYVSLFGGDANILDINVNMSRVNVTVKDVKLVDFDSLKEKNMGVLVVGNVVKCANAEFAESVSAKLLK